MARIRDFAVTEQGSSTSTSIVCNMPEHQSGDVLIYFASKDGTPVINATAGWTNIQDGASAGCAYRSMWKLAASAAEALTVDTGTAENWTVVVLAIEGADGSSAANLIADSGAATSESASDDGTMPFDGPSESTNADTNCLILHAWFTDSGLSPTAYAPLTNVYAGDSGANSVGVAYTYQRAAGAVAAASWFGRANDDGRGMVVAIKDASTDALVPGYSDPAVSSGQVLRPVCGTATTFSDSWPVSLTFPALGDDFDYVQRDAGGTFTDFTSACNDATASDTTFPTAVGHHMYFGGSDKFQAIIVNVATAGVAGVLAWEYYDGSSWVSTGVTGSNLTATGQVLITLTPTAVTAMAQTTINSQTFYWLRARVTTLYSTAIVLTQGRKGGRTATYVIGSISADNGTNPYTDGTLNNGSSTATTLAGFELQFGAALDLDTGIIYSTFRAGLRRDLDIDPAFPMPISNPGGLQVTFADGSNLYKSYIVHARGAKSTDPDARNVFAIDWNGSAVPWGERGSVNKSAVTRLLCTSLGAAGAVAVVYSMLSLVTRIGIAGGSSANPLSLENIQYVANQSVGMFPFIQIAGTTATVWVPLQLGGGDKICVEVDLKTFQFPKAYDGVDYFAWNAGANVAGIKFYPKSGDVLNFTSCLFTSESPYRFEFDASMASSGWTMSFAGCTIVGATVTLRSPVTMDQVAFISCPALTQNNAVLSNCEFTDTKVTSDNPSDISDCSFTSSGTGHAIEITTTTGSPFDLDNVNFTGYAVSDGSTGNEAIYNNSGGSITINVIGGNTPSIRNGAGASTTLIINPVDTTITVKDINTAAAIENARVLVTAADNSGPMPFNETVTITRSGATATVAHTAHGLVNGKKVLIKGANEQEYNGVYTLTYIDANSYSYTVSGSPATPATGTIKATGVVIDGLTNSSGIITDNRAHAADQPITGRVRKATSGTLYKTSPISGTIDNVTGFATTVQMIPDS